MLAVNMNYFQLLESKSLFHRVMTISFKSVPILQIGDNYGLGRIGNTGFLGTRGLNTQFIKILQYIPVNDPVFWH